MASHTRGELRVGGSACSARRPARIGLDPHSLEPGLPEREASLAAMDAEAPVATTVLAMASEPFDLEREPDAAAARTPTAEAPFDFERELAGPRAA